MSMGTDGSSPTGVAISADEIVVVSAYLPDDHGRTFVHVKLDKRGKPTIGAKGSVPGCTE
jgi:hypothetical protein